MLPARPGAAEAKQKADARRAELTNAAAPALAPLEVIGGATDLRLDGLRDKVVVLDFTATWCGPCRKIIPEMIALQEKHAGKLQVLAVTRLYGYGSDYRGDAGGVRVEGLDRATEVEVNRAFAAEFGLGYPVVIVSEESMRDDYGVAGIPTVFVIGKDGKVVGHVVGAGDDSHTKVAELVGRAL
jgi:thiol-disulfide isomerase/thioredoxin